MPTAHWGMTKMRGAGERERTVLTAKETHAEKAVWRAREAGEGDLTVHIDRDLTQNRKVFVLSSPELAVAPSLDATINTHRIDHTLQLEDQLCDFNHRPDHLQDLLGDHLLDMAQEHPENSTREEELMSVKN